MPAPLPHVVILTSWPLLTVVGVLRMLVESAKLLGWEAYERVRHFARWCWACFATGRAMHSMALEFAGRAGL